MGTSLVFEAVRFIRSRVLSLVMISIFVFSLMATIHGIYCYTEYLDRKEVYAEFESDKVLAFNNNGEYATKGFIIYLEVSPLSIFFEYDDELKCSIDASEVIDVTSPRKGKAFIDRKGKKMSIRFSLISFLCSIFWFWCGLSVFDNLNDIKLYKKLKYKIISIFNRWLILEMFLLFIFLISWAAVELAGINLTAKENYLNIMFLGFLGLFLGLFYLAGVFISFFKSRYILMVIILSFSIALIPIFFGLLMSNDSASLSINENIQKDKMNELMIAQNKIKKEYNEKKSREEKDAYMKEAIKNYENTTMQNNSQKERDYLKSLASKSGLRRKISVFFPPLYFQYLVEELSGCGDSQYEWFVEKIINLREDFVRYTNRKRYVEEDKEVKPFLTGSRYILEPDFSPPKDFLLEIAVIISYMIILMGLLLLKMASARKVKVRNTAEKTYNQGTYFRYFENREEKDRVLEEMALSGINVLDKVDFRNVNPKMSIDIITRYWCMIMEIDEEELYGLLGKVGVVPGQYTEAGDDFSLKIIYTTLSMMKDKTTVIDDVLRNADWELDEIIRGIISLMAGKGKTVIYLTTVMPSSTLKQIFKRENIKRQVAEINFKDFSMR